MKQYGSRKGDWTYSDCDTEVWYGTKSSRGRATREAMKEIKTQIKETLPQAISVNDIRFDRFNSIQNRLNKASPGPWFYNSYSTIISEPRSRKYDDIELEWERAGHKPTNEEYDSLPEPTVAVVPCMAGDTATWYGRDNAQFIAASREDVEWLLSEVLAREWVLIGIAIGSK